MRVGYPVINLEIEEQFTFNRMVGRSRKLLLETASHNLDMLWKTLRFNLERGLLLFRIRSDFVPYAAHPQRSFDWEAELGPALAEIGAFVQASDMRLTVHPDLFFGLCSTNEREFEQTLAELDYQTRLFDAMGLGRPAKIQMHAGEARGDPEGSLERFVERYQTLEDRLKAHLVLENDNVFCNLQRCLDVHRQTGIPIVFDVLHHEVDNRGEDVTSAMASALGTWRPEDGPPLVDYSSQRPDKLPGRHALSMDVAHFRRFLDNSRGFDFDLMLELKDRERGALAALGELAGDPRLVTGQRPVGQDAGGGSKERPSSAG